jgi:hypothetical protein
MKSGNPSNIIKILLKLGTPKSATESQEVFDSIIEKEKESRQKIIPNYSPKIARKLAKRNK